MDNNRPSQRLQTLLEDFADLQACKKIQSTLPNLPNGKFRDLVEQRLATILGSDIDELALANEQLLISKQENTAVQAELNKTLIILKDYERIVTDRELALCRRKRKHPLLDWCLRHWIGVAVGIATLIALVRVVTE